MRIPFYYASCYTLFLNSMQHLGSFSIRVRTFILFWWYSWKKLFKCTSSLETFFSELIFWKFKIVFWIFRKVLMFRALKFLYNITKIKIFNKDYMSKFNWNFNSKYKLKPILSDLFCNLHDTCFKKINLDHLNSLNLLFKCSRSFVSPKWYFLLLTPYPPYLFVYFTCQ